MKKREYSSCKRKLQQLKCANYENGRIVINNILIFTLNSILLMKPAR